MKQSIRILIFIFILTTVLMSACGGATAPSGDVSGGSDKIQPVPVEFTGVIENISGDQWTVGGQTITVNPAVVRDGPFAIGDTVKVEVQVQPDGSMVVTRVETPSAPVDADGTPGLPGTVDPSQGGIVFDDGGTEAFGPVDSIDGSTIVIGGQAFQVSTTAEFKDQIAAGNFVKVHYILNADGSMSITEIELFDPALVGEDNANESNSNDDNSNDDNSNDDNSNDDNSNDLDDDQGNGNDDSDDDSGGNSGSGGGDD